jgi:Fur family ferric uptake transcriptional regulator
VVDFLARQDCLVSAADVADGLRAAGLRPSLATIYRALDTLHHFGLVRRIDASEGIARYEPIDPSGAHHDHLLCEDCGQLLPFHDTDLELALATLAERLGCEVTVHEVLLRGRCSRCCAVASGAKIGEHQALTGTDAGSKTET